jgi:formylglycine-generating enzyme required for sulfatase activity
MPRWMNDVFWWHVGIWIPVAIYMGVLFHAAGQRRAQWEQEDRQREATMKKERDDRDAEYKARKDEEERPERERRVARHKLAAALAPTQMIAVDGGTLTLDRNRQWHRDTKAASVKVAPFEIQDREVSIGALWMACEARTGCDASSWIKSTDDPALPAEVSYPTAEEHCKSLGLRLPTADEWWMAAIGRSKKMPFEVPKHGAMCIEHNGRCPVAGSPGDRTPEGAFDLIGNIKEWSSSTKVKDGHLVVGADFAVPYRYLRRSDLENVYYSSSMGWGFRCARSR